MKTMKTTAPRLQAPPNARAVALQVLLACRPNSAFVQELLDQSLRGPNLISADRRLATSLVYGVLRRRKTLDALLRPLVSRQPHEVERWLWEALRLGAFQLALLEQIPAHAALHETVELAAQFGQARAKGFLNAVLRALLPLLTNDEASGPAADALPLEAGRYRRLARAVLPDPAAHPLEYLAAGFSWPPWLAQRWLPRYGWEECVRLGFWFAGPVAWWLRCNPLRCSRDQLLAALRQAGIAAEPGELPQAVRLAEHVSVRDLPGYDEGWFTLQDESAMRVASALAPEPGGTVLDLCAAPGTKTTHLAELMGNQGRIIACDTDARRLEILPKACVRLGVSIVQPTPLAMRGPEGWAEPPTGPFDAVLVDVPCSNTGVLGKRPEVRWRLSDSNFGPLVRLQTKLLLEACERVKPGGAVVYSTCSIEPEENRQVVDVVLHARSDMMLEEEDSPVPGRPADGGYWARLRRRDG